VNRRRGLLAFVCTLVAVGAVALHLPLLAGLEELGRLFAGANAGELTLLERAFTPPTSPELMTGPGGLPDLGLFQLRKERRADPELRRLAEAHGLDFALLKAFLAQVSQGVLDEQGNYQARLAEGEAEVEDSGPARTQAAAALLGRYRQQTGSEVGALIAWEAGVERASRVVQKRKREGLEDTLKTLRRRLIAPLRDDAEARLCTVWGLAQGLGARWPVAAREAGERAGLGVRLGASPGEALAAPMSGRVGWTGTDGPRGKCVELLHGCSMRTELCGLVEIGVHRGDQVQAGQAVGQAGRERPVLHLWLGLRAMDASLLLVPEP
jgi:murein DD-endopeptidase MepM/ murein hydrolase activator NlpD